MNLPSITTLAKSTAEFVRYEDGRLFYVISYPVIYAVSGEVWERFEFPIPVDDAGGGSFGPSEKGLTLMRWIRKHLQYLQDAYDGSQ